MRSVFEFVPIILAMVAVVVSGMTYPRARRTRDRWISMLAIVCALLLLVAQSSWFTTLIIEGKFKDETIFDHVWTIFNSLVMVLIITVNAPRNEKKRTPITPAK